MVGVLFSWFLTGLYFPGLGKWRETLFAYGLLIFLSGKFPRIGR